MTERFERSDLDGHLWLAGIGFAKTQAGNCSLMGGMERVRSALQGPFRHLPILAGPSRKGFLGRLTGVPSGLPAASNPYTACVHQHHQLLQHRDRSLCSMCIRLLTCSKSSAHTEYRCVCRTRGFTARCC